jgi:hypothetical protein
METPRPFKSALFVPGDRPERVDKIVNTNASAVIIDLEDEFRALTTPVYNMKKTGAVIEGIKAFIGDLSSPKKGLRPPGRPS